MLLSLEGASKIFADRVIFQRTSIKIEEGDRIGVVGVNGAGKTTLLRVLTGELPLEEGQRMTKRGLTLGYLRQNSGVTPSNTIYEEMRSAYAPLLEAKARMDLISKEMEKSSSQENTQLAEEYAKLEAYFSSNDGYNMDVHIETVLRGMGFGEWDRNTLCGSLSGGEKTRLSLAKILLQKPDLLLLDEPTNYLDLSALEWLEQYLTSFKNSLVVVSHDRYFLDQICNRIWDVTQGTVKAYPGNYSKYFQIRENNYQEQLKNYQKEQEEIEKLKDYIARNKVRASTAAMAKSREKQLEALEKERASHPLPPPLLPVRIRFRFQDGPVENVLEVKDLSLRAGGLAQGRKLFEGVNLKISRGQRVAILGKNGVGKSSLLRAFMDQHPLEKGQLRWGIGVRPSWFEQESEHLCASHTVLEEMRSRFPRAVTQDLRQTLAFLQFRAEDIEKEVRSLSGGEKARLKLAIMMFQSPNLLLLDEPTNHLDLMTREALDQALEEFGEAGGTVLAITHDRYLLNRMPWRILELYPEGIQEYNNYQDYLQTRQSFSGFEERKTEKIKKEIKEDPHHKGKKQRALDASRRKRYGDVEREISQLEAMISQKEADLSPEIYSDYQKLQEAYEELNQMRQDLEARLEEWADLESELKEGL